VTDNDITITVDADNNTTAAFGAAARGANTVGDAVNNANRALRESANRAEAASLRLQQLAARQREAADRARFLQTSMNTLRTAIAQTGDASGDLTRELQQLGRQEERARISARVLENQHRSSTEQVNDLARAYRRAENNAQQALRAQLMFGAGTRLGPDGNIIFDRNRNRVSGDDGPGFLTRALSTLPGLGGLGAQGVGAAGGATSNPVVGSALLGLGAGAVALGAPLIGGAVTGAVGAAAGIGGVGLGVAGAIANDPDEFRKRWDAVMQDVTGRWVKASASWMEPVKGSIAEVDRALRKLPIESILSNSAAYLEPLTKGLTGFATNLAVGFDSLIKDVGPVMDMLGKRLPKLGDDFGDFFAAIGKGSEGGAVALDDLLYAVGRLTKGLGVTLSALAKMYEGIHDNFAMIGNAGESALDRILDMQKGIPVLDGIAAKIKELRSGDDDEIMQGTIRFRGAPEAESDFKIVQNAAANAAKAIKDYIDATQKMLDLAAGDKSAGLALSEGWITLNKELKDGKRTLDVNTQAGIDNQKALLDQVEAAEKAREAQLALGVGIDSANAQFDANIERIRQMAYSLGFNKTQVDNLIASLGVLDVTKAAPKVELTGAQAAMDQGIALGAILNRLDHTYTARVQVVSGPGVSLGNALHHAIGGPTSPGLSTVNEWGGQAGIGGGEVMSLPTGTMVYGGAAASGGMGGGGGSSGGSTTTILLGSDGSRLGDLLVEVIAANMAAQGGRPELLGLKSGR
jgi:hypothetical protein